MKEHYDVIIVGTGAAGLYCALNLPEKMKILLITNRRQTSQIHSWHRAESVCCAAKMTMKIILKIPCGQDIMRIINGQ